MKALTNPISLAKKLVSINSVSGNEREVAYYIYDYLKSLGLKPELQNLNKNQSNVFCIGKGNLIVNGHIDTVPFGDKENWNYNPLGQLSKTKLYGRGTCDTKGSIASFLSALAKNPSSQMSCSFTVNEEDTFAGVKALMKFSKTKLRKIKY